MGAAFETVSPQEAGLFGLHIAKSRNIHSIGPAPDHNPVFVSGDRAHCASGLHVVHQVVAQLSAGIPQSVGKLRGGRIQQDAH